MSPRNGFILLPVLMLALVLMTLLIGLTACQQRAYQEYALARHYTVLRYNAEAGLSYARVLSEAPEWCTDAALPSQEHLKDWLVGQSDEGTSIGHVLQLSGAGGFKIVKIAGHPELYSIGFIGKDLRSARYKTVIKEISGKRSIL